MEYQDRVAIVLAQSYIFLMMAWFLPWHHFLGRNWGMSVRAGFTVAFGIWWIGGLTMASELKV